MYKIIFFILFPFISLKGQNTNQISEPALNIPNLVTPNGDGINDKWIIEGLEKYPNTRIIVVDRDGREILKTKASKRFEWDCTYSTRAVPAGSYWYILLLEDGSEKKGFLTMKR